MREPSPEKLDPRENQPEAEEGRAPAGETAALRPWDEGGGPPPAGIAPEIWRELSASFDPFQGTLPPGCDLFTLWGGLVALTQEIKLQGRTFRQLADLLSPMPGQLSQLGAAGEQQLNELAGTREEAETFQQRQARQIEQLLERLEQRTRRETLDLLLDLRELAEWARESLGSLPPKAVITVPAYFSDAQHTATREAGRMAGLEVVRILNEPTAASLAYGYGDGKRQTLMVYDLGGEGPTGQSLAGSLTPLPGTDARRGQRRSDRVKRRD